MHPAFWLALCRRELIELTRGLSRVNGMVRILVSVGVFLPWIAEGGPWPGAGLLPGTFPWLILCAGSAQLAVWVHDASARDSSNRETLGSAGVSPFQLVVARASVGLVVALLTATSALGSFVFLAPMARFSTGKAFHGALSVAAGLVLTLACSLWVTSKTRPPTQSMSAIVFSLLVVWLGLPVAGEWGREGLGIALPAGVVDPAAVVASAATGRSPLAAGWIWLLLLCGGFLLAACRRARRAQVPLVRRTGTLRVSSLAGDGASDAHSESLEPCQHRFWRLAPDVVVYLKQAACFFAIATVCLLQRGSGSLWLWFALSAVVVGQMFYGSWIWHTSVSLREEDRGMGNSLISQRRFGRAGRALAGGLGEASRWSRWTSIAFYLVLSLVAWLGDASFPWVLFLALAAVLPMMPVSLTQAAWDLAGRTSPGFLHFAGVTGLIVWPLLVGGMLGGVGGAKGFLAGTALGVLFVVVGMATLGMVASSPRLGMTLRFIRAGCDPVLRARGS